MTLDTGPKDTKDTKDKAKEKIEAAYEYAKTNTRDTIVYALLIVGLLLLFFEPVYGGLIVGLLAGIYFAKEIRVYWKEWAHIHEQYGLVKSFVGAGFLLALLISAPALFIGVALAVAIRQFVVPDSL